MDTGKLLNCILKLSSSTNYLQLKLLPVLMRVETIIINEGIYDGFL